MLTKGQLIEELVNGVGRDIPDDTPILLDNVTMMSGDVSGIKVTRESTNQGYCIVLSTDFDRFSNKD